MLRQVLIRNAGHDRSVYGREVGVVRSFVQGLLPFVRYPYKGEAVPCNLCGSVEISLICNRDRRWKPLRTVACADCGLMRTDPMPTEMELDGYYAAGYRMDYQMAGKQPPRFHLVRSLREAELRFEILRPHLKPGMRVLDVGCGTGEFLRLVRDHGCQVIGVEPGGVYASFARAQHRVDVIQGSWRHADLPVGGFDVVTCRHVIEHLREPCAAIGALAHWLKPGGLAFVSVPDMRPNTKPSFERFHFAHVHGFTPTTLDVAMKLSGLVPEGQGMLRSTEGLFRKDPSFDRGSVIVRDPARARHLVEGYASSSVLQYVWHGHYFRDAVHRLRKWGRDVRGKVAEPKVGLRPVQPSSAQQLSGQAPSG